MDNNLSSPTPNFSQSPFSGGWLKWIFIIVIIVAGYRFGSAYFSNPVALNNLGQQIQQGVDSVINSLNGEGEASPAAMSTTLPTNATLDNAIEKTSELSSCMNYADQTIRNTIDYYDRFVDFQNPNKTSFSGLTTEASWQTCIGDINQALTLAANTPELDAAIRKFKEQGEETVAAFKDITAYYKQKNYLDDNFALGKAKDAQLIQQALDYIEASDAFRNAVDHQEDLNNEAQVTLLSQDPGAQNQLVSLQLLMEAKKVLAVLSTRTINATALEKSINDLVAIQTKFATTVLPALKSGNAAKYSRWSTINSNIDDFVASAKNTWRLVRDNKPVPTTNEGSLARAVEKFNNLVQSYNLNNSVDIYKL